MTITVASLHVYPVKGCRGVEVERFTIDETGPRHDRLWQVVDDEASPITQRQCPELATIEVELNDDGGLGLSCDGHGAVEVSAPAADAAPVDARSLLGWRIQVGDAGDEVATWLSDLLGRPARLVAQIDETDLRVPPSIDLWGHKISFADAAPILVANQASCDWLAERASEPFGIDRFRANIIVTGAEPWAEDTWASITVGGRDGDDDGGSSTSLTAELPWPRCAVPQVDQVSGQRHKEPALALKAHRWCTEAPSLPDAYRRMVEGNGLFGVACDAPAGSTVRVGDEVRVDATRDPVLAPPAS